MTKTEIENKIHDLKRNIESCENIMKANENEIKKLEAEKERPAFERVEEGKKYYTVATVLYEGVVTKEYIEEHRPFDGYCFKNNNYFHTKERAEEVADKINFLLKLERLHDTFCPDYIKNKEKIRERASKRYIHKISYCKICGVKLPHGRQKFCLECLLKSYKGNDIEKYRRARKILYCRGYDTGMIEDECKERGII